VVSRVLLQDFTGVAAVWTSPPCAASVSRLEKSPKLIEAAVPVDLVVDHSVQVDFARWRTRCS